jgi:hypothetical protein
MQCLQRWPLTSDEPFACVRHRAGAKVLLNVHNVHSHEWLARVMGWHVPLGERSMMSRACTSMPLHGAERRVAAPCRCHTGFSLSIQMALRRPFWGVNIVTTR